MPYIARTPEPPYYAVIFTSINADVDHDEHEKTSRRLVELAQGYEGFLGIETGAKRRWVRGRGDLLAGPPVDRRVFPRPGTLGGQAEGPRGLVRQPHDPHLPGRTRIWTAR